MLQGKWIIYFFAVVQSFIDRQKKGLVLRQNSEPRRSVSPVMCPVLVASLVTY